MVLLPYKESFVFVKINFFSRFSCVDIEKGLKCTEKFRMDFQKLKRLSQIL